MYSKSGGAAAPILIEHPGTGVVTVRCASGELVHRMPRGGTLREAAEALGLALGAGCGAGDCAMDLVRVLQGAQHLSPPDEAERSALERIGVAPDERLACRARVLGHVVAALPGTPTAYDAGVDQQLRVRVDDDVRRVVIVGDGVAGSTALKRIAALSPDCHVTVIGAEPHGFYNRMDIARLIDSAEGAESLVYPTAPISAGRPPDWRTNTLVDTIDPSTRSVVLGTGERLGYDRLLLATGAASARPPVPGAELAGCFRLRTAGEAIAIRSWLQCMGTTQAVVIGAGVLGLEAAEVLGRLGVSVHVLETGSNALPAQLLPAPATAVATALARRGVQVRTGVQVAAIRGADGDVGRVGAVELADGESIPAGLVLFCTGNRPNLALAEAAGLRCGQGIVVDAQMRTSDPCIFAAGDVAELDGHVTGLWEPAREQALAAADSMLGLAREWRAVPLPVCAKLKCVGIVTIGALPPPAARGAEILLETAGGRSWRQLVLDADGRVVAAAFVNAPRWVPEVEAAARDGRDLRPLLEPLRSGRWEVLRETEAVAA